MALLKLFRNKNKFVGFWGEEEYPIHLRGMLRSSHWPCFLIILTFVSCAMFLYRKSASLTNIDKKKMQWHYIEKSFCLISTMLHKISWHIYIQYYLDAWWTSGKPAYRCMHIRIIKSGACIHKSLNLVSMHSRVFDSHPHEIAYKID